MPTDENNTVTPESEVTPAPAPEPETLPERLIAAGLTKEEVAEAMREVLQELHPASEVDTAQIEREYFTSLISK